MARSTCPMPTSAMLKNAAFGDARAQIEYNVNYPEWRGQEIVLHDPSPWKFMNGSGVLAGSAGSA